MRIHVPGHLVLLLCVVEVVLAACIILRFVISSLVRLYGLCSIMLDLDEAVAKDWFGS